MNTFRKCLYFVLLPLYLVCAAAQAEDIDIFAGTRDVEAGLPNVIFVIDNSSNWSRCSQDWPDVEDGGACPQSTKAQGQSEARAIKAALATAVNQLNVGIIEYNTGGTNDTNDSGYVRFALQPYEDANGVDGDGTGSNSKVAFDAVMDKIYDDINDPDEKRDSSGAYADLPWDFYNYLAGENQSKLADASLTPADLADATAYDTPWSNFKAPLLDPESVCADTYLIFIGNNTNGQVTVDDVANSNALKALYTAAGRTAPDALRGDVGDPLPIPEFVVVESTEEQCGDPTIVNAGTTTACVKKATDACKSESEGGYCPDGVTCTCSKLSACTPPNETYQVSWETTEVPNCETVTVNTITPTDSDDPTGGLDYNFDDWAKFLNNVGVPVAVTVPDEDGVDQTVIQRVKVRTFVIDVFNKQSDPDLSGVWYGAAKAGNGRYFQARSEEQIFEAIQASLGDIIAKSSSFAAVTMPLSANNAARFANEIYVGMFRPAPGKSPRWYGNLKLFELARFNEEIEIADRNKLRAIVAGEGIVRPCAETWWTYDSDTYWQNLGVDPTVESTCSSALAAGKEWSDLPDGPFVEKGGVAEVTRLDPDSLGRNLYTVKSGALAAIVDSDAAAMGGTGTEVLDYVRGDIAGVGEAMPASGLRSTVHGGVVHSRPLAVRYDNNRIIVYYGADDGVYRAVDAAWGQEIWGLIAPEHFSKLERLYNNSPLIDYEGATQDAAFTYAKKDYFFDGSTGSLVSYAAPTNPDDQSLGALEYAYIYPVMRRGGRMVYALDVTDPDAPSLMWRQGCPNLDDDIGCTTGFTDLGQTWSTPVGIKAVGYPDAVSDPEPLVLMGGGFDDCLNADQAAYPAACSSANGKGVYVMDAVTGNLVMTFATDAPVLGNVAPVDLNADGLADFAYLADVAGNIYRIRFADLIQDLTGLVDVPDGAVLPIEDSGDWVIEKIAATSGNTQRFYNSVTAGIFQGTVFVTVGSGDRERPLEANYPYADDVQNYFYVIADTPFEDYVAEGAAEDAGEIYTRRVVDLTGSDMYQIGTAFPDGVTIVDYEGYYWPLSDRGEQVSSPAAIGGGQVLFSTFQPGGETQGICEEPLGIGQSYSIALFNPETPDPDLCAGGGYCLPDTIFPVEGVFEGCEDGADCDPCPEGQEGCNECPADDPNCRPTPYCDLDPKPEDCSNEFGCIRGGFDFCDLDPEPAPTRGRTYYSENIDRD